MYSIHNVIRLYCVSFLTHFLQDIELIEGPGPCTDLGIYQTLCLVHYVGIPSVRMVAVYTRYTGLTTPLRLCSLHS